MKKEIIIICDTSYRLALLKTGCMLIKTGDTLVKLAVKKKRRRKNGKLTRFFNTYFRNGNHTDKSMAYSS